MSSSTQPLIDYLHQLQAKGQTHINVDDEARTLLRAFYKRVTEPRSNPQPSVSSPSQNTSPQPQYSTSSTITDSTNLSTTGSSPAEKIETLKKQALNWLPAQTLNSFRQTMIFSMGNPQARIMFVGEAPEFNDERLRKPFAGKAGQKLDAILKAMGTSREEVYITNILKFRPKMPNQTTSNRKPTPEEIQVWLPFVKKEIKIVAPEVIITLGRGSTLALLGNPPPQPLLGQFHTFAGIPLRATYHPSFILNDNAVKEKKAIWDDMKSVMQLLGMPLPPR